MPRAKSRKDDMDKRRMECKDIMNVMEVVDKNSVLLPDVYAANISWLPKLAPSEADMACTTESAEVLRIQVAELTTWVSATYHMLQVLTGKDQMPISQPRDALSTLVTDDAVTRSGNASSDIFDTEVANLANLLQVKDDAGQWFTEHKKKKETSIPRKIISKAKSCSSSINSAAREKPKGWHIFVGCLDPVTSADDLTAHLSDHSITVIDCKQLERKEAWHDKFVAFHVVTDYDSKDRVFEDDKFWPAGTDVRDWFFGRPYYRSRLWYKVSSVCHLSVCL